MLLHANRETQMQRDGQVDVTEPTVSVSNTSLQRAKNYSLFKEYPEINNNNNNYYYYYYTICMSLVTGHFFLVLLSNQRWSPQLTLQASLCSTFRIMCDVPSIAVFCSEYIECFSSSSLSCIWKIILNPDSVWCNIDVLNRCLHICICSRTETTLVLYLRDKFHIKSSIVSLFIAIKQKTK